MGIVSSMKLIHRKPHMGRRWQAYCIVMHCRIFVVSHLVKLERELVLGSLAYTKELIRVKYSSSLDFATMLKALARPEAFPFLPSKNVSITVLQTHASAVLLTQDRVYKVKKPKNFGFFDYSTPALRHHFCEQEVCVNRRLAPQVYLGIAPVLLSVDKRFLFGPTYSPGEVPIPDAIIDGGIVMDYAVVMVRLPDVASLESRVRGGTATSTQLAEIARYVAKFHGTSQTDEHIARFGKLEVIRGNWEENFEQMRPFIGRTLDAASYDCIVGYIRGFLEERDALFTSRVRDGRIRDCHGDLRLQHVYLLDEAHEPAHRIAILDGIEFNERFRYSDVAAEIAFLTMELDAAGRYDLSRAFVESYVSETDDTALREVLPFYTCYRACVRGKVLSLQLDESEVPAAQRERAELEARSLFGLAASYVSGPTKPTLVLIGGLMGTGKSTLAHALQHELGWALFSSDIVRKQLAQLDPAQPQADAFERGVYSPESTAQTYLALCHEASRTLADGRSVVLDASFLRRGNRQAAIGVALAHSAIAVFVECVCPREIVLKRLAHRWRARLEGTSTAAEEASRASDGRPDLYDAQRAVWEPFDAEKEPQLQHVMVKTAQPLPVSIEHVLDALHRPHFACWL